VPILCGEFPKTAPHVIIFGNRDPRRGVSGTTGSERRNDAEIDRMNRILLKSKIHRATVTQAELHYEGSVTVDSNLLDLADIVEYEQVQIYNVTNGNRLTTYAIRGAAGSGIICINGAAAHLVRPGDMIIICTYAQFDGAECDGHAPKIVFVDPKNRPKTLATT
jgi:aspartate 1-decarboxylase